MSTRLRRPSAGRLRGGGLLAAIVLIAGGPVALAQPGPTHRLIGIGPGIKAGSSVCDPLDLASCLLPFPSDFYTVSDSSTATGRRVNFPLLAMPKNAAGKPIDPTEWNRNDGFSPGSAILVHVPNIDLAKSGVAGLADIGASMRWDAPIVLLDTQTGKRWPYWAELDKNAEHPEVVDPKKLSATVSGLLGTPDPLKGLPISPVTHPESSNDLAKQALIIRPARNFPEGHRIIVALRAMRDHNGALIPFNAAFGSYVNGTAGSDVQLSPRVPAMERTFADLAANGINRFGLFLAWDFTVASANNIAGRMLHIRDDAFASLRGKSPTFTINKVTNFTLAQDSKIAREVTGSVTVPSYLTLGGNTGATFNYVGSTDGLPTRLGGVATQEATFTCRIPRSVVADAANPSAIVHPGKSSLYGHGLLGGQGEVGAGNVSDMANEHRLVFCAADWIGMATEDIPTVATLLVDMSNFPKLADRVQQGVLNFLFLSRAMISPDGFDSNAAFQVGTHPVIDRSEVFYDGNSQGGIIGGVLMAVTQDIHRGVLGVPGINYSTLLNRSSDFDRYSQVMYAAYPDRLEEQEVFGLIQMLWDRAEGDGYVAHITNVPYPHTPAHRVLYTPAFGDHQVSPITIEVAARTNGALLYRPVLDRGRTWERSPWWGVGTLTDLSSTGSAVVLWDSGSPTPPIDNVAPKAGHDPHEDPRHSFLDRIVKARFLLDGIFDIRVCGGRPCHAPQS